MPHDKDLDRPQHAQGPPGGSWTTQLNEEDRVSVEYVKTEEGLPPVGVVEKPRWTPGRIVLWVAIALIAGAGWTDRRVLFGHHFAAISGAGPLVGPILAAQMGYLPGTLWIIVGVILAGGVQDYMVLYFSVRRNGRSLGQMTRDELGKTGGVIASLGIILIMVILIAVLGVVIINALAESPWG
ncbi:carbon starvation CstA family protein, partial [Nocardia sp. NPDC059091]|uniref:carbon starvation CstA family protein n=1 Tax=Nocardia sp. NPDC059091 TaxID=3346724 RepID=UPI00367F6674